MKRELDKEEKVSDKELRRALLRGVEHHAMWEKNEDPVPTLTQTRFTEAVRQMESEERALNRTYDTPHIVAMLISEERKYMLNHPEFGKVQQKLKTNALMAPTAPGAQ